MCPDLSHQWRQIEIRVIWEMFHPGHWSSCEEQSVSWLKQPSSGHSRVIMLSSWRSRVTRLVDKSYQNNDQQLAISDNIWDLSNTHVDVVSVVDAYNSQDQSLLKYFLMKMLRMTGMRMSRCDCVKTILWQHMTRCSCLTWSTSLTSIECSQWALSTGCSYILVSASVWSVMVSVRRYIWFLTDDPESESPPASSSSLITLLTLFQQLTPIKSSSQDWWTNIFAGMSKYHTLVYHGFFTFDSSFIFSNLFKPARMMKMFWQVCQRMNWERWEWWTVFSGQGFRSILSQQNLRKYLNF